MVLKIKVRLLLKSVSLGSNAFVRSTKLSTRAPIYLCYAQETASENPSREHRRVRLIIGSNPVVDRHRSAARILSIVSLRHRDIVPSVVFGLVQHTYYVGAYAHLARMHI